MTEYDMKANAIKMGDMPDILPKEYLMSGIFDLLEKGLPHGLDTGVSNLDDVFRLDTGRLAIITGVPNDGKSEFVDFLTTTYNKRYGLKTLYFSPENQPIPLHLCKLVSKFTNKRFTKEQLSETELQDIGEYIADNFFFYNYDKVSAISPILDIAKSAIDTRGVKILVIDSYNKVDSDKPNEMNETDFIGRFLDKLCSFAIRENVLILLVAHPRKMESLGEKRYKAPTAYDINGSANFFNKSDFVLSVYRNRKGDDDNSVCIGVQKVKFSNYGKQGVCNLMYDIVSGNYYNAVDTNRYYDDDEPEYIPQPFQVPTTTHTSPLDVEVSLYRGATDNIGTVITLRDFLFTEEYRDIANNIRQGATVEERHDRKSIHKGEIPCCTIAGVFSQRDTKHLETSSGLLCLDIDYKDNKDVMDKVPDVLRRLDYVIYAAKSITGDGMFAICKVSNPELTKEHFLALEQDFKEFGITLDKACKDITRLRFATYDDSPYYNQNAKTYMKVWRPEPPKRVPEFRFVDNSYPSSSTHTIDEIVHKIQEQRLMLPDDYNSWFKQAMVCLSEAGEVQGREYFHTISALSPKYNPEECDEQFDKCISHYSGDNSFSLGTLVYMCKEAGMR